MFPFHSQQDAFRGRSTNSCNPQRPYFQGIFQGAHPACSLYLNGSRSMFAHQHQVRLLHLQDGRQYVQSLLEELDTQR